MIIENKKVFLPYVKSKEDVSMAITRVNNIRPEMLRWAIRRAGSHEEEASKAIPALAGWLSGEKKPTIIQLQQFANKFHVPFGYLFLQEAPMENIPFPMFRGDTVKSDHFNLNVYDTIMHVRSRQDWLEEYLEENDIDTCQLVGTAQLKMPIGETVFMLRKALKLEPRWAFSLLNADAAVSMLTKQMEEAGIFLAYNGVVGNNTHRPLQVSECRGFALASKTAPYIFVNSTDSKSAQLFTLIHEAAHLMLGVSAGHAGEETTSQDVIETYCDRVAAEFLVPATVLHEIWNGDIKYISRRFKVSEIVIARRAHDLGMLSDNAYRTFWLEYRKRPVPIQKKSGRGDFYQTSVKRVGRLFAIHIRNAVNNRQLSYTEAYRLTGLHGNTYQHFMTNNI